jgi:hypothetical protein
MKITYTSIETACNRHIKAARNACVGLSGYKRAEAIKAYFAENGHPHAQYTFDQMAMNRSSDHQFAIDLIKTMADLCAKNETGYTLKGVDGLFHFEKLVGGISFNNASVNRYSKNGCESKQLITVEYDNKVHGFTTFNDINAYETWVDFIMQDYQETGLNMMYQIANALDPNWTK